MRAEEPKLARAFLDDGVRVVLGTARKPAAGEQQVEPDEEGKPDRERERGAAGRIVGQVPVEEVRYAEEDRAAKEQPAFYSHAVTPAAANWSIAGWSWKIPRLSMAGSDPEGLALLRVTARADLRVVQVERWPLRPDARYRGEVVPRRRAGGRPLQRVGEAPRIVDFHLLAVLPGHVNVVEEEQVGHAQNEGADRGHLVQRRHQMLLGAEHRVVRRPPRLAQQAEPVLHQERH